jgi:hypothetical protein
MYAAMQRYPPPLYMLMCSCVGLARTIYMRCIYGAFGREITKYTVIYIVYTRFWPTLLTWLGLMPAHAFRAHILVSRRFPECTFVNDMPAHAFRAHVLVSRRFPECTSVSNGPWVLLPLLHRNACSMLRIGQRNRVYTTVNNRIFSDFPAKNTVYAPYIYIWFWPTLSMLHWDALV